MITGFGIVENSVSRDNECTGILSQQFFQTIPESVLIRGCVVSNNGTVGIAAEGNGIQVEGNEIVVDSNHCTSNGGPGIKVSNGLNNTIVRNVADAYDIDPGNDVGPIGTAAASTSPWANIDM